MMSGSLSCPLHELQNMNMIPYDRYGQVLLLTGVLIAYHSFLILARKLSSCHLPLSSEYHKVRSEGPHYRRPVWKVEGIHYTEDST